MINLDKRELTTITNRNGNVTFTIESNQPLPVETIQEIETLDLSVYWNDDSCKHYSFDTKLNNGYWLENTFYNNELDHATSLILN